MKTKKKPTNLEVKLVSPTGIGTMRFSCDLTAGPEEQMTNRMFVVCMAMARADLVLRELDQLDTAVDEQTLPAFEEEACAADSADQDEDESLRSMEALLIKRRAARYAK